MVRNGAAERNHRDEKFNDSCIADLSDSIDLEGMYVWDIQYNTSIVRERILSERVKHKNNALFEYEWVSAH